MKKLYLIIMMILLCSSYLPAQAASIVEEQKLMRTYPFSDPDPVPIMVRWSRLAKLYPYYVFSEFSDTPTEKSWKFIRMENPYIKVL